MSTLSIAGTPAEERAKLSAEDKELMDKASTAFGTNFAQQMTRDGIYLDVDKFKEAFSAVMDGKDGLMTEEQIRTTFQSLNGFVTAAAEKEKNAFFIENAKKEGVTQTDSGLQYEVMTAAEGPKPKATDEVTVHYVGTLLDGSKFDSSVDRGEPATFPLNGVIKGWTEGVQLMSVGEKFRFWIPSDLGYGDRGSPPKIPGGATLVFEVELIKIK